MPNVTCLGMAPRDDRVTLAASGEATVGVGTTIIGEAEVVAGADETGVLAVHVEVGGAATRGRPEAPDVVGVGSSVPEAVSTVVVTVAAVASRVVAVRVSSGTTVTLAPAGTDADLERVGEPGIGSASAGSDATKALVLCVAGSLGRSAKSEPNSPLLSSSSASRMAASMPILLLARFWASWTLSRSA